MSDDDEIHFPTGFSLPDLLAYGNTALVLLDQSTDIVVKASGDGQASDETTVERQIYERFVQRGGHKGMLIYHGAFEWASVSSMLRRGTSGLTLGSIPLMRTGG